MITFDEKVLALKLQKYLSHDPEALRFVHAFNDYCHSIDDIIDEKITDPEKVLKVFVEAATVYSSNFYQRHSRELYSLVLTITNTYVDSIKWEKDIDLWKRNASDVLRSCGNDMMLLVIGLVAGWDAMRDVSELVRNYSYVSHHNLQGDIK